MGLHYLLCFIHVYFSLTLTVHLKFFVSIELKMFYLVVWNVKNKEFIKNNIYVSKKSITIECIKNVLRDSGLYFDCISKLTSHINCLRSLEEIDGGI